MFGSCCCYTNTLFRSPLKLMKEVGGNLGKWWVCLWTLGWGQFLGWILILKFLELYTLNVHSFLNVSHTSIKWPKKRESDSWSAAHRQPQAATPLESMGVHARPHSLSISDDWAWWSTRVVPFLPNGTLLMGNPCSGAPQKPGRNFTELHHSLDSFPLSLHRCRSHHNLNSFF